MRKLLAFALMTATVACAQPARWEKAGVDEKAMTADMATCRRAAEDEAFKEYPGPAYFSLYRWGYFDQRRFYEEGRLTDFCMRNKGYQRVTAAPVPADK